MVSFDEEDAQTLVKLGLNPSQAKIYLTLVSLGVAGAKKIAQTARIDRGEVYRRLEILQERALVEKIIGIPTKYKPTPFNNAIEMLIRNKEREHAEIKQKTEALLKKGAHMETLKVGEPKISIIPGNYSHEQLPSKYEYLQKEEVWYDQIENVPFCLNLWDKTFKKAFARGIQLRAIAELNKPTRAIMKFVHSYAKENPNFLIRFDKPTLLTTFAIYDNKEMHIYPDKKPGFYGRQVFSTTNPVLVEIFKDYFELRWNNEMREYPKIR